MDLLQTISHNFLAFVIIISILVFIHEFGHYWVAIKNGVKVTKFSIGFGPELFGWDDKRGTHWRIALIPLGGYVQMFGDVDPASLTSNEGKVSYTPEEKAQAFYSKSVGQRAAIVAAGPGINFLFCIAALVFLFVFFGRPEGAPLVNEVIEGKPAAIAGIQKGDLITAIDGKPIRRFQQVVTTMASGLGQPVDLTVKRGEELLTFHIQPEVVEIENRFGGKHVTGRLGIMSMQGGPDSVRKLTPMQALGAAVEETWNMSVSTLKGLWQMIMGERSSRELSGALTIAKLSGEMSVNISSLIYFMAILSANLGLINLFPIPVLDGGHLAFFAAEAVRGKALSDRVQEYSLRFGLALVLTLTGFALWNDLRNFGAFDFVAKLFS